MAGWQRYLAYEDFLRDAQGQFLKAQLRAYRPTRGPRCVGRTGRLCQRDPGCSPEHLPQTWLARCGSLQQTSLFRRSQDLVNRTRSELGRISLRSSLVSLSRGNNSLAYVCSKERVVHTHSSGAVIYAVPQNQHAASTILPFLD
jgi:hypothetical protein